jgi:hypothetical protein
VVTVAQNLRGLDNLLKNRLEALSAGDRAEHVADRPLLRTPPVELGRKRNTPVRLALHIANLRPSRCAAKLQRVSDPSPSAS